jgi:hypothetical protein
MEVPTRRATEERHERGLGEPGDLADVRDPDTAQLLGRDRPDSPEPLDRQRMEERELVLRRHQEQPVRFRHAARDLREELRPCDPDRDRQADFLANVAPESDGDLAGRSRQSSDAADVEERLVDRQPFDERRRVVEDAVDRFARLGVGRHPRLDHDRSGAEAASTRDAHGGLHPVRLRLVTRREHHPRADDHRLSAQVSVVSLLDRREEGVDVRVENGRVLGHEHMFA